jgi:GAF domain-containing protein
VETFWVDVDQQTIILASCAGAYAHLLEPGVYRQIFGQGIIGTAVQTRETIVANRARQHPAFYYLQGAEVQAEIAVPLKSGEQVIGLLNVDSEQVDAFSDDDVTLLQTVGDQMAVALEKVRLFEETRQRADDLSRLFAVAQDLAMTLAKEELLYKIIHHLTEAVQATSGYILELNPDQTSVTLLVEYVSAAAGEQERVSDVGRVYALADYPTMTRAMKEHHIVTTDLMDSRLNPMEYQQLVDYGVQSALLIPFIARGRVLGEAEIWESRHHRIFTPQQINLAQAIAQHAAIIIDNAHLFAQIQNQTAHLEDQVTVRTQELSQINQQLRQEIQEREQAEAALHIAQTEIKAQAEALSLVSAIADTLHRTLDFQAVVERAVNALVTYARFTSAAIFALDKENESLNLLAYRNFTPKLAHAVQKLPLHGSLGGQAVNNREIIVSANVHEDARLDSQIKEMFLLDQFSSIICIPIFYQTEVLGTAHLLSPTLPPLTPLNYKTLLAIGRTIGLAMANARYVNQIEAQVKERKQIEAALREALAAHE